MHTRNKKLRLWLPGTFIFVLGLGCATSVPAGQTPESAEAAHAEQVKAETRERAHDHEVQRQAKTIFQSVADRFNVDARSACAQFIKRVTPLERVKSVTCSKQKKSAAVLLQSGTLLRFRL